MSVQDTAAEGHVTAKNFTTEQFVKAFIAELVLNGIQAIPPRRTDYRKGLRLVVEKIDEHAEKLLQAGVSIIEARPWIDAGNQLRLSPTGSVENWERAFRAAQLTFVQIGNPSYEIVTFTIDEPRAKSELATLDSEQSEFIRNVTDAFLEKVHANG